MGANGRRNLLAILGTAAYIAGGMDGVTDLFPGITPATFFFWGTGLLTTSVLRRKK